VKRRWGRLAYVAFIFTLLFAFFGSPATSAQSEDEAKEGEAEGMLTIRAIDGTDRKAVGVTLLWTGNPTDLSKLSLRENGAERKVTDLVDLRATGRRIGTVVVMDLSGSMNNNGALTRAKDAVADMARNLPEGDQIAIVSFSNDAEIETAFTSNADQVQTALDAMAAPADGRTAMFDGIRKAVSLFPSRPGLQPNVLLVTDGKDDVSGADLSAARASVVSSGAAFFAVELTHMEGEVDSSAIQSIIDRTGGATFSGTSEAEIAKAFTDVMTTMRSQFVATYASQVEQGAIDLTVAVGTQEDEGSFVAGGSAQGGASTTQVVKSKKAFGPDWLRSNAFLPVLVLGLAIGLGVYAAIHLAGSRDDGLQAVLSPYTEGSPLDQETDNALAQTAFLQRAVEMTEDFAERQGFLEKVSGLLERADLPLRAAEALFCERVANASWSSRVT
jgi:Mg-chelatase subunit ChlD